ncbi:MAG: purine-nucleoside phosphorylase [Oscillospiraceae bacterium]|nr:purine-nucleoside phosphorylase [Oscillospiraceae bacterium]
MAKTSISASITVKDNTDIAKVVLMPGDPLRAKHVADHYLENPVCFNTIRNMLGYTCTYRGKKISVMGSGMGIPSLGIYATELYNQFDVDAIIRIGSAGGLSDKVKVRDVVIAMAASTNSSYGDAYGIPGQLAAAADYGMLADSVAAAKELKVNAVVGNVYSSDFFYYPQSDLNQKLRDFGHLAVEMEAAGLYWTAAACHKKALSILTISDHIFTGEALSAEERQNSFHDMMKVALETAWHAIP